MPAPCSDCETRGPKLLRNCFAGITISAEILSFCPKYAILFVTTAKEGTVAGRLILASSSPRRRELLASMGLSFEVVAAQVDERLAGAPGEAVRRLAGLKAREVARQYPGDFVLGADTLVAVDGFPLGKPQDLEDAARMLRLLSGRWHEVHTGVCLIAAGRERLGLETTRVRFEALGEEDIRRYCASGEPLGKAGAYAIQGMAGMFIPEIRGSYSNVVGLPTALVRALLMDSGYLL